MVCLQRRANILSAMRNPVPGGCRPVLLGYLLCNLLLSCAQTQHDDWRGVTGVFNPANDAASEQATSAPSPAMQAAGQAQDVQTRIFLTAIDTTFTEDPRARASDLRAAGLDARARAERKICVSLHCAACSSDCHLRFVLNEWKKVNRRRFPPPVLEPCRSWWLKPA